MMISSKTPRQIIYLLVLGVTLTFTSCQKDLTIDEPLEADTNTHFDLKTTILEAVYKLPEGRLTEPQREKVYQTLMENLSIDQKIQVEQLMQTYAAQSRDEESLVSLRNSMETLLPGVGLNDGFGSSVAKSGNTLYVGTPGLNQVKAYDKIGGSYALVGTITASNGAPSFGSVVATYGNWLAVSAPYGVDELGAVFLYQRVGNNWVEQQILTSSAIGQFFGRDLAMHGNRLAVLGTVVNNTAVAQIEVFELTDYSQQWSKVALLGDGNSYFWDMDLYGNTVVANGGEGPSGPIFAPAVYIFNKGRGGWSAQTPIPFPFGNQLLRAISIDQNTIVANTAFSNFAPSNKSFVYTSNGWSWSLSAELLQPMPLPFASTRWVDVQGNKAIVAVPTDFGNAADVLHVFERAGSNWTLTETLTASTGSADNMFGVSPLISGPEIIVGSPDSYPSVAVGNVFIYE